MNYITMLKRKKKKNSPQKTFLKASDFYKFTLFLIRLIGYYVQAGSEKKTFGLRFIVLSHKKEMPTQERWAGLFMSDGCRLGHPRDEQMPINESQRALSWVFIIQIQSFPK